MQDFHVDSVLRGRAAGTVVVLALILIIIGLCYHQLFRHEFFLQQSENNRIRIQPIIPKRGVIFDRNMQVITDNRLSFTVSIVPFERVEGLTIPKLSELLAMDSLSIEKRAKANFVSKYFPSPIKRGLGVEVISVLEERGKYYPGITYSVESVRRTMENVSAETFLGYVGEISPEEIKADPQGGYRMGSLIGKKGIEKTYDRLLRGIEGTKFIEVSAQGQIIGSYQAKEEIPAVPGNDLVLSIDRDLQQFIAESFDSSYCCGGVVAIDPQNGEILGLASFPRFDPNIFSGVIPPETWQDIISDSSHPLLNRLITGLYPPGSTTKLLTAGAGLELGVITEDKLLRPCYGGMQFGNRYFKCWYPKGHGSLNVYHAVEQSCDVFFYQLGLLVGLDEWSKYAEKCGFGKRTGIDIPGELAGISPSPKYYDKVFGKKAWSKSVMINLAIGQGEFTITPLQLAQFYCGLANNGKVYKPHLLRQIIYSTGDTEKVEPTVSFTLPFSQKTLDILKRSLELVVQGAGGTAKRLRNDHYIVAGKTGTAQNPHGEDHSWFVGFAPSSSTRIVVAVVVENAGHGSVVAAPIVGKIMDHYLNPQPKQEPVAELDTVLAD